MDVAIGAKLVVEVVVVIMKVVLLLLLFGNGDIVVCDGTIFLGLFRLRPNVVVVVSRITCHLEKGIPHLFRLHQFIISFLHCSINAIIRLKI